MKEIQAISYQEWANFVAHHPFGSPFQHPDFYKLWNHKRSGASVVFFHWDEDNKIDGLVLAYPCSYFPENRWWPKALVALNGPLTRPALPEKKQIEITQALISQLSREKGWSVPLIELRNMKNIPWINTKIDDSCLNLCKEISDEESLINTASRRQKRNLRKINTENFWVAEPESEEEVNALIQLLQRHYRRIRKPCIPGSLLKAIVATGAKQESFRVLVTKKKGKICGGSVIALDKKTCYEWYIISDRSVKNSGVATTYGAMRYALKEGCYYFDFMGIGRPGIPYGVRDFKMGFGGEVQEYRRY
ncbi:MAG: GNAT family N-acetyltransferase, partial [Bacteroidia bacterium]|nr:GNAT family N-acetyltransferase [Bacteroidia bacterium]